MDKEIWKDIKGYEGLYQVSNKGEVKRIGKNKNLYKSLRTYYGVKLSKNNKKKYFNIHRLVAETFIPNPKKMLQINHKDGNKLNNNVNNLEWVTPSDNTKHAYKLKLLLPTRISPVCQYDLQGNFIKEYPSIKIARKENPHTTNITDVCRGKRKTAGGFFWKYKKGDEING